MKIDFNVDILTTLLYQNNDKAITITRHFPQIDKWKEKKDKPTINQLSGLATYFNVPFGYFFLNEIPKKSYPLPHFRSGGKGQFKPSNELQETLQILQQRQEWAKDIIIDFNDDPLFFANSISTKIDIEISAEQIRRILKLPPNWSQDVSTWYDAFKLLITRIEDTGVFVVINGVVNNNTHKKLNIKEFRGFVLYDEYAPFIFINGNDFISGKIFTIIHEFVHIFLGKSASFDLENLMPAKDDIEDYCDAVAAEFLVPKNILSDKFKTMGNDFSRLAKMFKVSRIVIARRLYDLNKISRQEFLAAYATFGKAEKKDAKSKGGDFYNTAPYRISRNFFSLVYSTVKQNKMLYRDAFRLTGLTGKTFDGYVNKHLTQ